MEKITPMAYTVYVDTYICTGNSLTLLKHDINLPFFLNYVATQHSIYKSHKFAVKCAKYVYVAKKSVTQSLLCDRLLFSYFILCSDKQCRFTVKSDQMRGSGNLMLLLHCCCLWIFYIRFLKKYSEVSGCDKSLRPSISNATFHCFVVNGQAIKMKMKLLLSFIRSNG